MKYPVDYAGYTLDEVIEQARSAKAVLGHTDKIIVTKTCWSGKCDDWTLGYGFEDGDNLSVGFKGKYPSGFGYEVVAIVD